ncbi:trypsin Inhibitor like cysteine rich domain protein [Ancylostoma caninum]|uniref:Trypsin Inhibitor like cysteine rich domain protein n=1 Tax=Ancylostoma caninum TaxID=29170 RepID=A0A368GXW9_ANCCA|nr:trypsin Inhibitor like cysteine rich domain protein [Ancylostoma caninum]
MQITLLLASGLVLISGVSARRGGGSGGCGQNEERKVCGTRCEPTCTDPHPLCTRACEPNVCQCRDGYLRDASNKCIRGPCGENEERKVCGSPCEPSCKTPEPVCAAKCIANVCQCRSGFFRNDENKCVRKKACRGKLLRSSAIYQHHHIIETYFRVCHC